MNDDEERKEIHRRLMLVKKKLEEGKIHLASHLAEGFKESFSKVQYASDGLVDLDTLDGRVRTTALMIAHFQDREDLKGAISLSDIQDAYFRMVDYTFGDLYRDLFAEAKSTVPTTDSTQFSHWFASKDEHVKGNIKLVEEFFANIREFWGNANEPSWIHGEDQRALKAVFGGETFPLDSKYITSTCGLYVDTIYLPCPFIKVIALFDHVWTDQEKVQHVIQAALNLLKYKEIALTELDNPIVAILPDRHSLDEDYRDFIARLGEYDALKHAGMILGREFESAEEIAEYCSSIKSFDDLIGKLSAPDRLLFDTNWLEDPLRKQIERFLDSEVKPLGLNPQNIIYAQSFMRMNQANDLLHRSRQISGVPLIEAPTSWRYFNWKLEYDSKSFHEDNLTDLHMIRGLQATASGEMQWLGNIPPDALIEMRMSGAIGEIRNILSGGVREIATAKPGNFYRTGDKIVDNIHHAFDEHQTELRKLRDKKWKFAGHDIGSFLVSGTLEISAALTGHPLFGLSLFGVNQFMDIPKLKEFPKIAKELATETDELKKSPVGLFFKHKD